MTCFRSKRPNGSPRGRAPKSQLPDLKPAPSCKKRRAFEIRCPGFSPDSLVQQEQECVSVPKPGQVAHLPQKPERYAVEGSSRDFPNRAVGPLSVDKISIARSLPLSQWRAGRFLCALSCACGEKERKSRKGAEKGRSVCGPLRPPSQRDSFAAVRREVMGRGNDGRLERSGIAPCACRIPSSVL